MLKAAIDFQLPVKDSNDQAQVQGWHLHVGSLHLDYAGSSAVRRLYQKVKICLLSRVY